MSFPKPSPPPQQLSPGKSRGFAIVYFLYFTPPFLAASLLSLGGPDLTRPGFTPDFRGIRFSLWKYRWRCLVRGLCRGQYFIIPNMILLQAAIQAEAHNKFNPAINFPFMGP